MVNSTMPTQQITIYYQENTTNQSFRDMSSILELKGIKKNKFHLILYDADLMNIDPRDKNLPFIYKQKVMIECMRNFWYFIREVIRIPVQGGEVGGGIRYKLTRANLAMNFGFVLNWNMFLEIPRQNGKTVSALCWYLWVFLFGTKNSTMLFLNKKHEASKLNLQTLKDIRASLPDYLQLHGEVMINGKKVKAANSTETINNLRNNNRIKTAPAARNKALANNLGRGMTVPFLYFDEYAFIPYNYIIYNCAAPAFSTASRNAQNSGAPYGIMITTTPGDLLTDEGMEAFQTKEAATPFSESWYDLGWEELQDIKKANKKSNFVYIKFNYKQLGRTEEYFQEMVKDLKSDFSAIRREILLEWAESATDSPFEPEDLEAIKNLVRSPIRTIQVYKPVYEFKVYKDGLFYKSPPIVGVDVAGGLNRDSSAITVIDTNTTEVLAVFNCNFISIRDLGRVLEELVLKYMPNAIVNIERNGGYGASLLQDLIHSGKIKNNLYYEIKDKIFEERYDGIKTVKTTKRVKVYGLDETHNTRTRLMEILTDRVRYHKDKFHSDIICNELHQLTIKKGGRIEHCDNGHDDTIFSMLLALYVWYDGVNLMANFHLRKTEIKTDQDESTEYINENTPGMELVSIEREMIIKEEEDVSETREEEIAKNVFAQKAILASDFYNQVQDQREKAFEQHLNDSPLARRAYCKKNHLDEDDMIDDFAAVDMTTLVNTFYGDDTPQLPHQDKLNMKFTSAPIER